MDNQMTTKWYKVPPALDSDFTKCNSCGRPFKMRGAAIDMDDFHTHKASCSPDLTKE